MRYCPAAAKGDGKEGGGEGTLTGRGDGSPQANGARRAPAGGQRRLCPALPVPPPTSAQYRRPGVSRCPDPLTGAGCPVRSETPRSSSSPSVPWSSPVWAAGGGARSGEVGARGMRAGANAAACLPRLFFFFTIMILIFIGTSLGRVSRVPFSQLRFCGQRAKRGNAAGGAPRFVRLRARWLGESAASPPPRHKTAIASGGNRVPATRVPWGASRTWNAKGGLCAGFPLPR